MNFHQARTLFMQNKLYLDKIILRNLNTIKSISLPLSKIDRIQEDKNVLAPFTHIHRNPSKHHFDLFRSFNYFTKVPEKKYKALEECLRIIHTSTIMIDDMQDNSSVRYNVPSAHTLYGLALTINAASHAMGLAIEKILHLEPKAMPMCIEAFIEGHRGQGLDIYWRENLLCPSEAEYMDMIKQKGSPIFIMVCRLLQMFGEEKTDCTQLAANIGIYFQVRDDYCNLLMEKRTDRNKYCSDITEGKFSFPIVHAIKNSDRADEVINILKQRTNDLDLKAYCVSILESVGSFKYTREMLYRLESDVNNEIQNLGGNPELARIMDNLGKWKGLAVNDN